MTVDGVTLKVQEKHFYDLTLHYFDIDATTTFPKRRPALKCRTIVLAESDKGHSASDIKRLLNKQLLTHYNFDLDYLKKSFTLVTHWAAVMPNIVGASVSANVAPINEKWMGCIAHQLNTVMKSCFKLCETDPILYSIIEDLNNVKILVRIFKQSGWTSRLGDGNLLIQEVETRFVTTYAVAERFMLAELAAFAVVEAHDSAPAHQAKTSIMKTKDAGSLHEGFPAIEAIVDACDMLVYAQKKLEAAETPAAHLMLPMMEKCNEELRRIELGAPVDRGFTRGGIRPSELSSKLCAFMRIMLREKLRVHDLWLAACVLHPFMRELQFVEVSMRVQYRERGHAMIRKLYTELGGMEDGNTTVTPAASIIANHNEGPDTICSGGDTSVFLGDADVVRRRNLKRKFDLVDFADFHFDYTPQLRRDELRRYLDSDILTFGLDKKSFIADDFVAVGFWRDNRRSF